MKINMMALLTPNEEGIYHIPTLKIHVALTIAYNSTVAVTVSVPVKY